MQFLNKKKLKAFLKKFFFGFPGNNADIFLNWTGILRILTKTTLRKWKIRKFYSSETFVYKSKEIAVGREFQISIIETTN